MDKLGVTVKTKFDGSHGKWDEFEIDLDAAVSGNGLSSVANLSEAESIAINPAAGDADVKKETAAKIKLLGLLYSLVIMCISNVALKKALQAASKRVWGMCGATALRELRAKYGTNIHVDTVDSVHEAMKSHKMHSYDGFLTYVAYLDAYIVKLGELGETVTDNAMRSYFFSGIDDGDGGTWRAYINDLKRSETINKNSY